MVKSWDMCIKGFNRWRSCALLPGNDVSPSISFPPCLSFGLFDRGGPNVNLIWSDVWQGWVSEWEWGFGFWVVSVCVCWGGDGKLGLVSEGRAGWGDQRWRGDGWEGGRVCVGAGSRIGCLKCLCGGGEQLDWGAATLPTLSSLSRINGHVRPRPIHVRAGLPYARARTTHT